MSETKFTFPQDDLTAKLLGEDGLPKYAIFLPAISNVVPPYIGKQRHMAKGHLPPERIPAGFERGIEGMNWLNKQEGYFYYKHNLFSAGHADLDINKPNIKEEMVYGRDRNDAWALGDSGGFQIGKGVWSADWKDPNCPAAMAKRKEVLRWLDKNFDYGMILDIPAWVRKTEKGRQASGVNTFEEAIIATSINNEYFMANRNGGCKFLNVVQGSNHAESDLWYSKMKKFCDPKQYENHFNGWAFGSQQACDPHLTLKRLIDLRFDGLLEEGVHDWLHVLGNSDMEWALLLSDIQRSVRKYHNPKFTISYDAASPFLSSVHGQIYYDGLLQTKENRWTFANGDALDDKKYAHDNRMMKEVAEQDGHYKYFHDSPISKRLKISDICRYGPGDKNKIGKEGNTSWDTFSYVLQMVHNVWEHVSATQDANRLYDAGQFPAVMSTVTSTRKGVLYYDRLYCKDVINDIFATSDRDKALSLVDHYSKYWMIFRGVRGNFGKKATNSFTSYANIYGEL